jgi:hypothetical protein
MKPTNASVRVTETTPLLRDVDEDGLRAECSSIDHERQEADENEVEGQLVPRTTFASVLALLLIGVFVANADTSLVLATYGEISSEFEALESSSWLLTGYMLSMCGAQPLVSHSIPGQFLG